jgi:hypothetical protein
MYELSIIPPLINKKNLKFNTIKVVQKIVVACCLNIVKERWNQDIILNLMSSDFGKDKIKVAEDKYWKEMLHIN